MLYIFYPRCNLFFRMTFAECAFKIKAYFYKICNFLQMDKFGNNINAEGQLNLKCLFGVMVWTKKPTKFFPGFLP